MIKQLKLPDFPGGRLWPVLRDVRGRFVAGFGQSPPPRHDELSFLPNDIGGRSVRFSAR
jgi:hypothetical protein